MAFLTARRPVPVLVMNGGRERTHDEFADLFDQSGFRLVSVTPTSTPLFVIEGVAENTK